MKLLGLRANRLPSGMDRVYIQISGSWSKNAAIAQSYDVAGGFIGCVFIAWTEMIKTTPSDCPQKSTLPESSSKNAKINVS